MKQRRILFLFSFSSYLIYSNIGGNKSKNKNATLSTLAKLESSLVSRIITRMKVNSACRFYKFLM